MTPKKINAPLSSVPIDAAALFVALRALLLPYRGSLSIVHDEPEHFYANCARPDAKGKTQFFGAVKVSGRKHLFHFMPVYDFPELLAKISPALRKRMQGKSCFNFDTLEPTLMTELGHVVEQGASRYRAAGKLCAATASALAALHTPT